MAIKNILFDLGGVIFELDYEIMYTHFENLGVNNPRIFQDIYQQFAVFNDYEKGKISTETFRLQAKNFLNIECSNDEFDQAWSSLIMDMSKQALSDNLAILEGLHAQGYSLYALSNINDLHQRRIEALLQDKLGLYSLEEKHFHKVFYSHEIGANKPNKEAFNIVMHMSGLQPNETVFIDDNYNNFLAGKKYGFNCIHFNEVLLSEIPNLINNF